MKRLALVAIVIAATAYASIGLDTAGALAQRASTLVLVKLTAAGKGTVLVSFRGPKIGATVDVPTVASSGEALLVCDGPDDCAADLDRGGFYVLGLHGRKGPIMLLPGVFERRALATLAAGKPAPAICVHATIHFIDEPKADTRLDGTFSAADGKGTVTSAVLARPAAATLSVGGPTHTTAASATMRVEPFGIPFSGPLLARTADCFELQVVTDGTLSRTRRHLDKALQNQTMGYTLARGTFAGKPFELDGSADLQSPLGEPTIMDIQPGATYRLGYSAPHDATLWLDFGKVTPPFVGAPPNAVIATLVADDKPHAIELSLEEKGKPMKQLGTVRVTRVPDPP